MSVLLLNPGAIFAGDYEIVGLLAEGGMGAVYVARQLSTGKERALKIMQPQLLRDERTRDRFTREARAASHVNSEHVIEVVAAGIDAQSDTPWLAMELLRGEDLESFAERIGPLPPGLVLEIFRQLCHGLAAAHTTGLVHRDLKPENVFLATARRVGVPFTVKILDFGIAKIVHETKRDVTDAVGTPTWMAPEQTEAGKAITPASDVWALGLIAFRLLVGMSYWRSANTEDVSAMAILREVVFDPMEPASARARSFWSDVELSPMFDEWFAKCVARNPAQRMQNATEALAGFERAMGEAPPVRASQKYAPIDAAPSTVKGEPFGASPPVVDPASATRVGPFTGPVPSSAKSLPVSLPPTEDVDQYERRLSRGKAWAFVLGFVALVVFGIGVWQLRVRGGRAAAFTGVEGEPNNRAPDANPLPFGEKVRGQIGQRLDAERSDRDFFRTTVPAGTSLVRLTYRGLSNIAPCIYVYHGTQEEALLHFCVGQPGRDLVIPALRLEPSEYLLMVLQDREAYESEVPPVLENVSDTYELGIGTGTAEVDAEIEPNDLRASANTIAVGASMRGRLAWMHDVDVFCTASTDPVRFTVDDPMARSHGAVLEVTPIGADGPGVPVRVHHAAEKGTINDRDVKSPYSTPKHKGKTSTCVSIALTTDIWAQAPLPHVAPAGDQEYAVTVESL